MNNFKNCQPSGRKARHPRKVGERAAGERDDRASRPARFAWRAALQRNDHLRGIRRGHRLNRRKHRFARGPQGLERADERRRRVRKIREKNGKINPSSPCNSTSSFIPITTMPTYCIVPEYNYFFKIVGLVD